MIPNLWDAAAAILTGSLRQHNPTSRTAKISDKQANLAPKGTRGRTKTKLSRRKEITKIRAEINHIETENMTEKINLKELVF